MTVSLEATNVRPFTDDDVNRVAHLAREAFRMSLPLDLWREGGRVLSQNGRIEAALCVHHFGQYFGGRPVPVAGLTMATVAPECRGRGIGRRLLLDTIAELGASDVVLSTLYPSAVPFYRQFGYEIAGARTQYGSPVAAVPAVATAEMEPWDDRDLADIERCYETIARQTNGLLQRSRAWWLENVLRSDQQQHVYRFLSRSGRDVTGYIVYVQEPARDALDYYYSLACRDLVWTDERSLRAILGLIGGQRALGREVSWFGPPDEPLRIQFDQEQVNVRWSLCWMSRIVRVDAALEARGYHPCVEEATEFFVADPLLPENNGSIRLEVGGGRGRVSGGSKALPRLDVGTLTSLYTGWLTAGQAARMGMVQGASPHDVHVLEAIFAGPRPWLPEHF